MTLEDDSVGRKRGGDIRPLVIGAGGMLGQALLRRLEPEYPETIGATRAEIDILDRFGMEAEIVRLNPTVVINCAAWTDVDGCTRNPARALEVNAEGAEHVARAAAGSGCRVVQVSTDFVFDGRLERPYVESDVPAPIQAYGLSKLEGERRVAVANEDHLIVRTAWLYGEHGDHFVGRILARARAGEPLRVVEDQRGSPTLADDLADGIASLLRVEHRGIVHVVNTGVASRYELARRALEAMGLLGRVRFEAVRTVVPAGGTARPAASPLDTGLFTRLTGAAPRSWTEALDDFLGREAGDAEA
ncbi:MAG TPA: dTDP-4-dehydrorhamnose reductase [Verrucomicrobiae bacterium]|nr:dTDP-4-dehydrorhamnose reductase [Verrucomicrobiae bacterium]